MYVFTYNENLNLSINQQYNKARNWELREAFLEWGIEDDKKVK